MNIFKSVKPILSIHQYVKLKNFDYLKTGKTYTTEATYEYKLPVSISRTEKLVLDHSYI